MSDAMLVAAFNKYESFQMAKVVRNMQNKGKSKGYGFVSMGDIQDGARALREMHGQYIGNRPVQLKRAAVEARTVTDRKGRAKKRIIDSNEADERKHPRLHEHHQGPPRGQQQHYNR